jgi:hypothetical protein
MRHPRQSGRRTEPGDAVVGADPNGDGRRVGPLRRRLERKAVPFQCGARVGPQLAGFDVGI